MAFVPSPSADWEERHGLIRPRAQAANPQLRCFVHRFNERDEQARHASRNPLPPSKPCRPHKVKLLLILSHRTAWGTYGLTDVETYGLTDLRTYGLTDLRTYGGRAPACQSAGPPCPG